MSHTYPSNSENPPGRPTASEKFKLYPEDEFGNVARALNVVARVPVVGVPVSCLLAVEARIAYFAVVLPFFWLDCIVHPKKARR